MNFGLNDKTAFHAPAARVTVKLSSPSRPTSLRRVISVL